MTKKAANDHDSATPEAEAADPRADDPGADADPSGGPAAPEGTSDGEAGDFDEELDEELDEEVDFAPDEDGDDDLDAYFDDDVAGVADLQDELEELNDRHLRLAAEFNNFRRRHETQMTEAWGRAQADLLGRLLDVLDDLQRVSALDPADEAVTVESIVEGIDLVERKFVRAILDAGAEVLEPAEGETFDPERMEAMMRVDDETGERDDQVAAVFQKGYVFKGNLVRPARVSVYKG